jgi:hypothetical protein
VNAAAGGTPAAPAVGPGKIGRGQTFNGTSEYIDFPGGQSPSPESALSMETWIKTTDAAAKGILGKWGERWCGQTEPVLTTVLPKRPACRAAEFD